MRYGPALTIVCPAVINAGIHSFGQVNYSYLGLDWVGIPPKMGETQLNKADWALHNSDIIMDLPSCKHWALWLKSSHWIPKGAQRYSKVPRGTQMYPVLLGSDFINQWRFYTIFVSKSQCISENEFKTKSFIYV